VLSILTDGDYDEGFAIALACRTVGLSNDLPAPPGAGQLSASSSRCSGGPGPYGRPGREMTPFKLYEDMIGRQIRLKAPVESA